MSANRPVALDLATSSASSAPVASTPVASTPVASTQRGVSPSSPVGRRINPPMLPAPNGYSHVVEIRSGRTVYLSGQVPLDRAGNLVGDGDFRAQTEQVFSNLNEALGAVNANFGHVVKLTIFVTQLSPENLAALREVRNRHIDPAQGPASSLVEVTKLFRHDLLVEIEAIAVLPD
jgi:enamine deaminase RidA (YjgF/YER057c/UK114 family)